MSYWKDMGLLRKDTEQTFEKAFLLVREQNAIKRVPFKYRTIDEERVVDADSVMPMTYDKRTKGIFVWAYWLPFVSGAKVDFGDIQMTVSSSTEVKDREKALSDGKGIIGLNVYFGE